MNKKPISINEISEKIDLEEIKIKYSFMEKVIPYILTFSMSILLAILYIVTLLLSNKYPHGKDLSSSVLGALLVLATAQSNKIEKQKIN